MNYYRRKTRDICIFLMMIVVGTLVSCSNDDTDADWGLSDGIAQDLCMINEPDQTFVEVSDDDPSKGNREIWKRDFPSVRYGCGEYQASLKLVHDDFEGVLQSMDWYMTLETRVCNRCVDEQVLRIVDRAYGHDPKIDKPDHEPDKPTDTMRGYIGYIGLREREQTRYMMNCGGADALVSLPSYRLNRFMAIPPNKMHMFTSINMVHPPDITDADQGRLFYYDHPVDYNEPLDWAFYWMKLYSRDEVSREGEETVWEDVLCGPEFIEDDETRANMTEFRARLFEMQKVDQIGFPEAFEAYLHSKNFMDARVAD